MSRNYRQEIEDEKEDREAEVTFATGMIIWFIAVVIFLSAFLS